MIMEFKTRLNKNGHRKYIKINTDAREFSRVPGYIVYGTEISIKDYNGFLEDCKKAGFKEVER